MSCLYKTNISDWDVLLSIPNSPYMAMALDLTLAGLTVIKMFLPNTLFVLPCLLCFSASSSIYSKKLMKQDFTCLPWGQGAIE